MAQNTGAVESLETSLPAGALAEAGQREQRRRERALRRAQLRPGDEFRPYDLFDDFGIVPAELLRCPILTSSEKLCWIVISKRLGRVGAAFPSYETIANDLAIDRRQAIRLISGLEQKNFLRLIAKTSQAGDRDSNEYRMLWHEAFELSGSDKMSPLGSVNLSSGVVTGCHPNSHHHQKNNSEKEKELGSRRSERKSVQSAPSQTERTKPSNFSPDDDEKPKRPSLEDREEELRLRLQERHGSLSEGLLQIVLEGIGRKPADLTAFLLFDEAQTGKPAKLKNPGGYYRQLSQRFRISEQNRRGSELKRQQRDREQRFEAARVPKLGCSLNLCDGTGEIWNDRGAHACECETGQNLSPKVLELMSQINSVKGAA